MAMSRRQFIGAASSAFISAGIAARSLSATSMPSVKPARLEPGMTVGLVTPASNAPEDEQLYAAVELVQSLGFEARPARNLFSRTQYLAGTDAQRVSDLNEMFADPEVDAIFCARGGFGSGRLLRDIDYNIIRANPKVLMGYSDITALLNSIQLYTGLITFHGPMAGENFSSYTLDQYLRVLVQPIPETRIGEPPPFENSPGVVERTNRLTQIVRGIAEGRLIGGNLSLLVTLMGTPYEPVFDDAILFLEDVFESPYSVDRMLTHLWLTGKLERLSGVVLGKFTDDDYSGNTFSMEEVLRNRFEPLGLPTLRGLMIGHVEDQTVVPIGVLARLDVDAGTLTLLESAVL